MDLMDIYKIADDPWHILKDIRSLLKVDTADLKNPHDPQTVAERVDALIDQMNEIRVYFGRCKQTEKEKTPEVPMKIRRLTW